MMRLLLILTACLVAAPAHAWGEYGHRLTAGIAWSELTPAARREVRAILAGAAALDTPNCPMASLGDASVWPDCVRALPDRFAFSFPWHYQNINVCQPFDIAINCPDGNCVTAQIPRQLAIAADRARPAAERAQALAFFVHFLGDMHQPLHIGDKADKGGNDVLAAYGLKAPDRMNLHRIWDSDLAERSLTEPPAVTPASITRAERTRWAKGDIAAWAQESWQLSRDLAYPALKDYPDTCGGKTKQRALVDEAYVAASKAALRQRIEQAGVRIAAMLNGALGSKRQAR